MFWGNGRFLHPPPAAALRMDFSPYLARHAREDWGDELDDFDKYQNDMAGEEGYRILSAYNAIHSFDPRVIYLFWPEIDVRPFPFDYPSIYSSRDMHLVI